jgi:dTDP-4-amino-4,6-dideoxygalactose transaminase
MFWKLTPVRRAVRWQQGSSDPRSLERLTGCLPLTLYGSGTQALAAALQAARLRRPTGRPEAILPAYGCPDLVSACRFAGVVPRLLDNAPGQWGYEISALEAALTDNTVAVLAVNLLGVGDQAAMFASRLRARGIALVQDSAQYLPDRSAPDWQGDFVIFSFGRGKPLNLLGGGALLSREPLPGPGNTLQSAALQRASLKTLAFNLATHPRVYWLASRLPGMSVGATRFHELTQLETPPIAARATLAAAYESFARQENYSSRPWESVVRAWAVLGIQPLCGAGNPGADAQRLRLPLLARDMHHRDQLVAALDAAGYGASKMYQVPLPNVEHVPADVASQGPFPNARDLAARLFTLPTHELVDTAVIRAADTVVRAASA